MQQKLMKINSLIHGLKSDIAYLVRKNGGFVNTTDQHCDVMYCSMYDCEGICESQILGLKIKNNCLFAYVCEDLRFLYDLSDDEVKENIDVLIDLSSNINFNSTIISIAESIHDYIN